MLTEDILSQKKLGCVDLLIIMFALEKAGIKYKINDDGSLTVLNVDYALVQDYYHRRIQGRIGDIYIDGHFDVITEYPELILICNERSIHIVPEV